ncbi:uncharacterized protein LOC121166427 [Ochotona curzoniae]|uniref:uncharacterized protein LOC121166427 n=1 Tax=Ochotona curzoniae TaxID=130825 RepID=UPI001B35307F|nr:uncharacterized protein LOC121166427 [Ochotona curzoniae]
MLTKEKNSFIWGKEQQRAFDCIKEALLTAPALGLPDVTKPFTLYVDEAKGIAKGVLTQSLGPWRRPVAYLSKKLDPVASGWPPCLRMVAAIATLLRDANKLTLGQKVTIIAPHAVESVVRQPPDRWLSNARMTHYQALLLAPERITFGPVATLNPASLLPEPGTAKDAPHDCSQILAEVHGTREDLTDQPLPDAEVTWFTDGSSYVTEGTRRAGAAVVSNNDSIVWASALEPGTSAQRAELIALTKALELAAGKVANIYTDSRYAFATAHVHGEIYRRRGLLTSGGREIKNKQEIINLLRALFLPKRLSIIHCPGHQKGTDPVARGNRLADQTAKTVATEPISALPLEINSKMGPEETRQNTDDIVCNWGVPFKYTDNDRTLIKELEGEWDAKCKAWKKGDKVILPYRIATEIIEHLHRLTHLSRRKMHALLANEKCPFITPDLQFLTQITVDQCKPCAQVNAGRLKLPQGARARGHRPGIQWEIDFTEVKPGLYGYKYLLVFVDTFSGWVEAYPTKNETATTVVKKLLEEIFPRYGLPQVLGSDNGPAFASQAHLQALRAVREYIWKPLAEAYKDKDIPPCPHPFKEGDQVYVRRHQAKTLEPRSRHRLQEAVPAPWKAQPQIPDSALLSLRPARRAQSLHMGLHLHDSPGKWSYREKKMASESFCDCMSVKKCGRVGVSLCEHEWPALSSHVEELKELSLDATPQQGSSLESDERPDKWAADAVTCSPPSQGSLSMRLPLSLPRSS